MLSTETYAVKTSGYEQKKAFSPKTGEDVGYERGAKMIKNYYDKNDDVVAHFIGRETIEAILDQPGVIGITMFNALNEVGQPKPVLVGLNSNGGYVLNITTIGDNGELFKQKGIVATGVMSPGKNPPPVEDHWL